jgi:hypothetical protein
MTCILQHAVVCWVTTVKQQYDAYDADKINRVFLTLQSCLIEVMKIGGGNGGDDGLVLLAIVGFRSSACHGSSGMEPLLAGSLYGLGAITPR